MCRIRRDNNGVTLVCLAALTQIDSKTLNRSIGNQQRTLAAHAMLKHVHAEHSGETPMRADGGTTDRAPIALPAVCRREGLEENLLWAILSEGESIYPKCVRW